MSNLVEFENQIQNSECEKTKFERIRLTLLYVIIFFWNNHSQFSILSNGVILINN